MQLGYESILRYAVLAIASAGTGCATHYEGAFWPDPRPLAKEFSVQDPLPPEGDVPDLTKDEPAGEITLRQAIALALIQSPDLRAFGWEVRAREARVLQASLVPNPGVSASVENLGGRESTTGGTEASIEFGWLVELGGKRADRMKAASTDRDLAAWDYEAKRIEVLTSVALAFIDVLASQRRTALLEELVRLSERSVGAVSERVKAGRVPPVEEVKANVALASVRIEVERSKRELDASRKVLATLWGGREPRFTSAVGELETVAVIPTFEALKIRLTQNPDLARLATEEAFRLAALEVEKSRAVPDITVSAGYKRFTALEDNVLLLGVSILLPIIDRNQGGIREAELRVKKLGWERAATELRLLAALSRSYESLSSAHAEVTSVRDTVLPGAQRAFDEVSEGYRLGRFSLLDVLDSQRTLFEARGQLLRALKEYHQAAVEVERLIGDRLDNVK